MVLVSSRSPDPVGSITGHRFDTAALLHDHVYVRFHDLRDLSNLAEVQQIKGESTAMNG